MGKQNRYKLIREIEEKSTEKIINALLTGELIADYQFPIHCSVPAEDREEVLKQSIANITYDPNSKVPYRPNFLDMGCGDGVFLIDASSVGYNAIGIEIEKPLVNIAKENIRDAYGKKILVEPQNMIQLIHGDMFNPEIYKSEGLEISDIDVFYFLQKSSIEDKLVGFIDKNAKSNARVLVYGITNISNYLDNMTKKAGNWEPEIQKNCEGIYFAQFKIDK